MSRSRKDPPVPAELHAGDLPKDEDRRKRQAESEALEGVAGAMAGEVIAAVAAKAKKRKR